MPPRHIALALAVVLLWGVNFVVMKHIVSELPPIGVTGLRFTLAAIPLVFFVPRPVVSLAGLLGFGAAFGIVKFGLLFTAFKNGMPAGLAAFVLQMQAVFTIVLAYLLGERPRPQQWLGVVVSVVGVAIIVAGRSAGTAALPVLLTLAAALAWAAANTILKREGRFDPLAFAVWSSLFPGIAMLAFSLLIEGPTALIEAIPHMSISGVGALAYLIYPVSIASGTMWAFLLSRHNAAAVAPYALLVPVVGLLCAYLAYGETFGLVTLLGSALIVAGLAITVLANRR